jgi:invasion protein IalB
MSRIHNFTDAMTRHTIRIPGLCRAIGAALAILYAVPGNAATAAPVQLAQADAPGNNAPASAPAPASSPGGATSINETYQDWGVACAAQQSGVKRCAVTQIQTMNTGQRVLAVEMSASQNSGVTGLLVLPFGLLLREGVTFQIDDRPAMAALGFLTCLPAGCLVPFSFDAATTAALRGGTALKVKATAADAGKEAPFSIPLAGLSTALDRAVELAR